MQSPSKLRGHVLESRKVSNKVCIEVEKLTFNQSQTEKLEIQKIFHHLIWNCIIKLLVIKTAWPGNKDRPSDPWVGAAKFQVYGQLVFDTEA